MVFIRLCCSPFFSTLQNIFYSGSHYKATTSSGEHCFAPINGVKAGVLMHLVPAMTPIPAVCRWHLNSYEFGSGNFKLKTHFLKFCRRVFFISFTTGCQLSGSDWRKRRIVGYHGESLRSRNQRQSGA